MATFMSGKKLTYLIEVYAKNVTKYQMTLKNAPTLTVFKDIWYGIYVTFFGMRLTRTLLAFDFF